MMAMLLSSTMAVGAQTLPQWPQAQPEAKAGARWWWMGSAVTAQDLQWNIGEYARCGIGSLEVTPIYGVQGQERNELTYLSGPWMQALGAAQQAGDQQGVAIDMNGGTGWPFGGPWVNLSDAAGKLVTKVSDIITADGNTPLTTDISAAEGNTKLNKVLAYNQDDDSAPATDVTAQVQGKTLTWQAPAGRWRIIAVYNGHTLQQVKRAAPGGEGFVLDHYDADAVARYLQHFEQAFEQTGARWPRSFFNDSYEVYGADWTPRFFDEFRKYRGYSLEDHMQELLGLKTDKDYQVLADYRSTLHDMLLNNFTRQWTRWAHSHGVTTRNQGHGSPGNLLDYYAAVDIPEIESFGISNLGIKGLRQDPGFTSQNLSDLSTLKYAPSAAHVTGKPLVSSETFTWLTEHFRTSLSQMKPDLDLMFCAGVNHVFFHGTTYTPKDAPWPGWKFYASIDMSPTNSIWADAPALMQYIERCQSFLQMGSPDNDLLVYAPFLDAMHRNTTNRLLLFDINHLSDYMSEVTQCVKNVGAAGLDCDYISDEQLLGLSFDGSRLLTAAATPYRALVVPASKHMPDAVRQHLEQLQQQGATIVWSNKAADLPVAAAQPEAMRTQLGLSVLRRSNDTGHHYFIANLTNHDVEGFVPLGVSFQSAVFFQPLDGTMADALLNDRHEVYISLRSGQSVILQTYATATVSTGTAATQPPVAVAPTPLSGPWALTLPTAPAAPSTFLLDSLCGWQQLSPAATAFMGTATYETTFTVSDALLEAADAGFRLDLGDVRESARVWLNGDSLATLWSVPYTIDVPAGLIRRGENTLRIDVTNLPANRIRQMDIDGQQWRIFKDVNILDVFNGSAGTSGVTSYASWQPVPSGLCSAVTLAALHSHSRTLQVRQTSFTDEADGAYPLYHLSAPQPISTITATAGQQPYDGFSWHSDGQGGAWLTPWQPAEGYVHFVATATDGQTFDAYMNVLGAYEHTAQYDFTSSEAPGGGWNQSNSTIPGFEATGEVARYVAKKRGKEISDVFSGITISSSQLNYLYFYPSYGMMLRYEGTVTAPAVAGTVAMLSYLVGSTTTPTAYAAADSLTAFSTCSDEELQLTLLPQADSHIYRQLNIFRPKVQPSSIAAMRQQQRRPSAIYDLQGRRLQAGPQQRGIYIYQGKKYVK